MEPEKNTQRKCGLTECDDPLENRHPDVRYCSDLHKRKAAERRRAKRTGRIQIRPGRLPEIGSLVVRPCKVCGKNFEWRRVAHRNKLRCDDCDGRVPCKKCGKTIQIYHDRNKDGLCRDCKKRPPKPEPLWTTLCGSCGEPMQPDEQRRKYCSQLCMKRANRLNSRDPETDQARKARGRARREGDPEPHRFLHREIFERDGWICQLCGEPVDPKLTAPDRGSASLDHRVPLSRGGRHTRNNCQLAHLYCNGLKSANVEHIEQIPAVRTYDDWSKSLAELVATLDFENRRPRSFLEIIAANPNIGS